MPQTHPAVEQLSIPVQSTEEPEELEGAVGGASAQVEQDTSSTDWLLSSDLVDPDLLGKIRCNSLRNVFVVNGNCSKHFKKKERNKVRKLKKIIKKRLSHNVSHCR